MTNEKLIELIDNKLQTQLVEINETPQTMNRRYVEQRVIEETIVNRRIISTKCFVA